MQQQYVAPELKLAGDADQVVLGGGGAGGDFSAEDSLGSSGFLPDGDVTEVEDAG